MSKPLIPIKEREALQTPRAIAREIVIVWESGNGTDEELESAISSALESEQTVKSNLLAACEGMMTLLTLSPVERGNMLKKARTAIAKAKGQL